MARIEPVSRQIKDGRMLTLRPMVPEDAQRMLDIMQQIDTETPFLLREPGEFNYTLEQEQNIISKRLESPDIIWLVAEVDGMVVGCCETGLVGTRQRIRHRGHLGISILKAYWGLGIGTALMQACIEWARARGLEQVELEVNERNGRAIALYERLGFRAYGQRPHGLRYPDGTYADEVQMCLML